MRAWLLTCAALFSTPLAVAPNAAMAECSQAPAPEVVWRRCRFDGASLRGVNLSRGDLRDTSLGRSDLAGSDLTQANLQRARLVSTSLQGATLDGANLTRADLTSADLTKASLRGASLRNARLFRANLRGANLTGAITDGIDLLHADLSGATWVDGTTICAEGSLGRCQAPPTGGQEAPEG